MFYHYKRFFHFRQMKTSLNSACRGGVQPSGAAEPASRAEIRTNRGGASLLPGTIIVEKLSSYPAKSKMHLHFLFPSVALRILLVTKSAAFSDFSVGLRMFF